MKRILGIISSMVVILTLIFGLYYFSQNTQAVFDWVRLKTNTPTVSSKVFADKLQLTDNGRNILYLTNPKVDEKAQFNADCGTGTVVLELGCYIVTRGIYENIYVLDIKDPRLASETDVAMAHELLHAAYRRLNDKEKTTINALLEKQLAQTNDQDLQNRLSGYAKSEPGEQNNELHSIFGSEFPNLLPELENYYADYFKNRKMIAGWQVASNDYLNQKETELNNEKTKIESDLSKLTALNQQMKVLLAQNRVSDYNSLVPVQNRLVDQVNKEISAYNNNVYAYNDILSSLNSHAYSTFDLQQASY